MTPLQRTYCILFAVIALFFSPVRAYAFASETNYYGTFMTLSFMGGLPVNGQTQTFFLQPEVEKTYASRKNNAIVGSIEAFAGLQSPLDTGLDSDFFWQIGLAIAGTNNVRLEGDIWEDANPNFNNYTFSYNVTNAQLLVKSRLFFVVYDLFDAYVSAGLGVSFNQSSSFIITPRICEEVPAPPFADKSTFGFAYSAGLGVQTMLSLNWKVNLGYEFINWGPNELNRAPGQTLGMGLKQTNFFVNAVTVGVTYIV